MLTKKFPSSKFNFGSNDVFLFNNFILGLIIIYLDNLTLNDDKIKIVEKPRANKIDIMLGLKLPGLKPIFNRLVKYIRDNIILF